MKVKIGPYKNWFGPYQLAELLCFWAKEKEGEWGTRSKPEYVHKLGEFFAHGFAPDEDHKPKRLRMHTDRPKTWLYKFFDWVESKKKRTVDIKIDRWDTWNMNSTLALIILPMLKQLQATKHGSPEVDIEDVPEHLRTGDDDIIHTRWDWILAEMIWAFEQLQPDCDWEDQYYSGEHDTYWEVSDTYENGKPRLYKMEHGPDHTFKIDMDGLKAHGDRIQNGCRLFGKYFQNLWD